jgi:hypothetical protein
MSDLRASHKSFPPGRGQLRIPLSSRGAALAGLSLYATCRRTATLAQRATWMCVSLLGPRAIVGKSRAWQPLAGDAWEAISQIFRRDIGAFDEIAGYARTDASRGGLSLLLLQQGSPVAFVKMREGVSESLDRERLASELAYRNGPLTFRVPQPIASGYAGGWSYFAVSALPARLHSTPTAPPIEAIAEEIGEILASLPRAAGTEAHWLPMHGDFTPWNLREVGPRELVLLDWEDAAWAPPGADEVLYRAASSALTQALPEPCAHDEAIRFWRGRIGSRDGDARDRRLDEAMLRALAEMERST